MPVEDTEVHEKTKDTGRPYGCSNRPPYAKSYRAPNGYDFYTDGEGRTIGELRFTEVTNTASTTCMNDASLIDPKCSVCRQRGEGEKYWVEYLNGLALPTGTAQA